MANILKIKKAYPTANWIGFFIIALPIEGGCGDYKSIKISSVESRFFGCA